MVVQVNDRLTVSRSTVRLGALGSSILVSVSLAPDGRMAHSKPNAGVPEGGNPRSPPHPKFGTSLSGQFGKCDHA